MSYPAIIIRNHHERRLAKGHAWAFSNELKDVPKDIPPGTIVRLIREFDRKTIGYGFYHPNSLIAARIISRESEQSIDADFWSTKLAAAAARRDLLSKRRNAVRLVHSESDGIPGLIIERYNDIITFQIVSAGIEAIKDQIVGLIDELWKPRSIIEKNKSHLRKLEGLEQIEQIVKGPDTETEIFDAAGTKFQVSLLEAQKTGFYLDQMENRVASREYIKPGAKVLDLFTNEGGFAINLAKAGASHVIAVDASKAALEAAKRNAALNDAEIETVEADCFDYIRDAKEQFDVIVLDPPSLVKSKKDLKNAMSGYLSLHKNAIRQLATEGILITASCSHHFTRDFFLDTIRKAAQQNDRTTVILEERGAASDHPVLAMMPETEYLKVFVVQVI
jgi:23S rRNA (cytosine1962-C5)-methyltransferase